MKKASNVRLSLRKLLIAALAIGPIAVLPGPVWAAVPVAQPYTVANGTAVWTPSGLSATIEASDRAVIVWNVGGFNIAADGDLVAAGNQPETFNFNVPQGGAVLNKVGYSTAAADNAIIDGTLFSTGRVFVLANGTISVGGGASITTTGGLFLSTLAESNDFSFTTTGNLALTGASSGAITIGNATNSPSISGGLEAWAGSIDLQRAAVTGDLILRQVTAATDIVLSAAAGSTTTVSGNLTVITNNGSIGQVGAITVGSASGDQTTTLSTGTSGNKAVNLGVATNNFEIVAVNAPGANGDVTLADSNIVTLAASTIGNDLSVTATGTANKAAINSSGTLAIGGDASFTASATGNSGVSIAHNSTVGGVLSGTVANSSFSFNGLGNIETGAIAAGTGNKTSISVTAGSGALSVGGALSAAGDGTDGGGITLTGGSVTTTGTIASTAAPKAAVTLNATTGSISIGAAVGGAKVVAKTAGGSISQTLTGLITTSNATTASSFDAGTGTISLGLSNVFVANQTIQLTGGSASLVNTQDTRIGKTSLSGGLTLTLGTNELTLGSGAGTAGQDINIGGTLTVVSSGAIQDEDYTNMNIFGGLNLTTTGAIDLDAAEFVIPSNIQFGRVDITGATTASITETTTLNLGTIGAATLTARSVSGGIVDSGVITVPGVVTLTAPATQSIVLDSAGHNIGTVVVQGGSDNSILVGGAGVTTLGAGTSVAGNLTFASSAGKAVSVGSVTVGNLTVNSGGTISLAGGGTISGDLNLTSADTSATSISDAATGMTVAGVTTISSSGGVDLGDSIDFSSVVLNGIAGDVKIEDANDLTISGNATGNVTAKAGDGSVSSTWALKLGNMNVGNLTADANNGGAGNSGTITQLSGTSIHAERNASFSTDNANIVIANNGNSFGRVAAAAGDGAVTLVEDGFLKLGNLTTKANSSITSRFGSIIEDTTGDNVYNSEKTLTLKAPNGSVLIGNTTHTDPANTTGGNVSSVVVDAPNGAVAVTNTSKPITLGNINALSLSVNATSDNITQSGSLKVFGAASFTSSKNITLTNSTNNFGRVSLTTTGAGANISVTEGGTLNLGSVSMPGGTAGNFTATSLNGHIIDTGLAGVRPGGAIVAGVATAGTGLVTLSAVNGNIVLDDPTTDFVTSGGVVFNAHDVTLSPLGQSTLVLGSANAASVADNLTVTSAVGNITNAGNLTVSGNASFQTGTGNITLNQAGNRFGTLKFVGNQISISQTNDMNIVRGSSAIGPAQLASGSYITIAPEGSGVVSFGNTVSMSATGSIVLPKLVQAVGTLSVNAAGTKDLSALSLSADLSGKTPVNSGTGTYLPPQP